MYCIGILYFPVNYDAEIRIVIHGKEYINLKDALKTLN